METRRLGLPAHAVGGTASLEARIVAGQPLGYEAVMGPGRSGPGRKGGAGVGQFVSDRLLAFVEPTG